MNKSSKIFLQAATEMFGEGSILTRDGVETVCNESGIPFPFWFVSRPEYRVSRGQYKLPAMAKWDGKPFKAREKIGSGNPSLPIIPESVDETIDGTVIKEEMISEMGSVTLLRQRKMADDSEPSVPVISSDYIPFGFYDDLIGIISSKAFYPVFITGMSGNGKTLMVEQACGKLRRECIRVNISIETDESDLLGSPSLIDGNVVFRDGPVVTAMKRGAILLIDEIDRGSNKLMCLQGILEGKPYYNKKSGEMVYPTLGFNVIATANTKGRGSDEGKYLSQILDDAFLERFPITVEQEYPDIKTELKILKKLTTDIEFAKYLVQWADIIRKTHAEDGVDEVISTRRLVYIVKAYLIFQDKIKAITLSINRFDEDVKNSFLQLYTKVDGNVDDGSNDGSVNQALSPIDDSNEIPF